MESSNNESISINKLEYSFKMKCSICKQHGHNKRTCKKITTQSNGLSKRLTQMVEDGRRLNDDSCSSEGTLSEALCEIIPYMEDKCKSIGASLNHNKSISLFECQEYFHKYGGPPPNENNKKVSMKPDGGIFTMSLKGVEIPLLIIEDKFQGTNDIRKEKKKINNQPVMLLKGVLKILEALK